MTRLSTVIAFASALSLSSAENAIAFSPPPLEQMEPLEAGRNAHDDLYIAATPAYGMYRAPTWLRVASRTNETDLTGASFIWRSGLQWFSDVDLTSEVVGGNFMEWNSSYIEVTVFLNDGATVTLDGTLTRMPGCWTDFDHWFSPSFVDQYGVTWPATILHFDFPNTQLQSLLYYVPTASPSCAERTYTMHYQIYCIGLAGELGDHLGTSNSPWPASEGCVPAKEHNTTQIYFQQVERTWDTAILLLSDNVQQVFRGRMIEGERDLQKYIADASGEAE